MRGARIPLLLVLALLIAGVAYMDRLKGAWVSAPYPHQKSMKVLP